MLVRTKRELIDKMITEAIIRQHSLFTNLDEQFGKICAFAKLVRLQKKNPVPLTSERKSRVYFLASGAARLVSVAAVGEDYVSDILVDGEPFGDFSLTGSMPEGYIIGLRPSTHVFYFFTDDFKKLLNQYHQLSLNYNLIICNRLRYFQIRHYVWTRKDARERLLFFFRAWAACTGTRINDKVVLENYFSIGDIGDFIGVSRQFLHIMLNELKQEGFLYYSRKQIWISDQILQSEQEIRKEAV